MAPLPNLKPKDVEKILSKKGFLLKRQTGSHRVYFNENSSATVIVPFHGKDIPKGTLSSIIKQSKLSTEEFIK